MVRGDRRGRRPSSTGATKAAFCCSRVWQVRSDAGEWLDHLLIAGQRHLAVALHEFVEHYNTLRPHRSLDQYPPAGATVRPLRRERIGGLVHATPTWTMCRFGAGSGRAMRRSYRSARFLATGRCVTASFRPSTVATPTSRAAYTRSTSASTRARSCPRSLARWRYRLQGPGPRATVRRSRPERPAGSACATGPSSAAYSIRHA